MPQPVPSWLLFAGLGAETAWATAATATDFYPILKPKFTVKYENIEDDGYRSNASRVQAYYQGVGHTEVDWPDMAFYPNASGHFLKGIFGADSVVTGAQSTHTITLLNTALPTSYTGVKYTGLNSNVEQVTGIYWSDLQIKFANPGKLAVSVKGMGTIMVTNVSKPSNTYEANSIFLPWQATVTIAGGSSSKLIDAEINYKRAVEQIFGFNNAQGPTGQNSSVLDIAGKLTFVPTDYTELNYYLSNTQPSLKIVFTSGSNSLTLQMTKCAFVDPTEVDHGSPYAKVTASFTAVANSTDAGTGNAPGEAVLVNSRAAAY